MAVATRPVRSESSSASTRRGRGDVGPQGAPLDTGDEGGERHHEQREAEDRGDRQHRRQEPAVLPAHGAPNPCAAEDLPARSAPVHERRRRLAPPPGRRTPSAPRSGTGSRPARHPRARCSRRRRGRATSVAIDESRVGVAGGHLREHGRHVLLEARRRDGRRPRLPAAAVTPRRTAPRARTARRSAPGRRDRPGRRHPPGCPPVSRCTSVFVAKTLARGRRAARRPCAMFASSADANTSARRALEQLRGERARAVVDDRAGCRCPGSRPRTPPRARRTRRRSDAAA